MIRLEKVSRLYNTDPIVKALDKVSFAIDAGEFISVVGTSGSGKTTMLSILGLIDKPTVGKMYFDNQDLSRFNDKRLAKIRGQHIGFVVQDFALVKDFTVAENILMALDFNKQSKQHAYSVLEVLAMVDLSGYEKRKVSQLSGGQQQRVAIARALIKQPSLLLCDEPTGNLDGETTKQIVKLLQMINKQGTTIVLITHDMEVAMQAKRIIKLEDGKIMEDYKI